MLSKFTTKIKTFQFRISNLFKYFNVVWHLTDSNAVNTLMFIKHEVSILQEKLYLNDNIDSWAEKLQDINYTIQLLNNQINDDYFKDLKLNLYKYPNETIDIGQGRTEPKEFRSIKEIEEDENLIMDEEERCEQDLDNIFKILSMGMFYPDGIRSWEY